LGFSPIISITQISLFIFLNPEINFEWTTFFFSFLAQAAHPTSPLPDPSAQCPPSLPDCWAPPAYVLLRPSRHGHNLLRCKTPLLPPLNRNHYPPPCPLNRNFKALKSPFTLPPVSPPMLAIIVARRPPTAPIKLHLRPRSILHHSPPLSPLPHWKTPPPSPTTTTTSP
jgi:hypothetical protein